MIKQFSEKYRFLSNFWPCRIDYKGYTFDSVEHAYQAQKCADPMDITLFLTGTPGEAKRVGSKVKIRSNWEDIKLKVMEDLVRIKFSNPELKHQLLLTKNQHLQEGNYWNDSFWGVNLKTGIGENNLGKIIMKIRKECT